MRGRTAGVLALLLTALLLLSSCAGPLAPSLSGPAPAADVAPAVPEQTAVEQAVTDLPLAGPIATPDAEISGMAWYSDTLVLLPQYPDLFGDGGALLMLDSQDILAALDNSDAGPLTPQPLPFDAPGVAESISGFEGYEAIAFAGDRVFVAIEAETEEDGMMGYLLAGTIEPDLSGVSLMPETLTPVEPQSPVGNMSYESLLVVEDEMGAQQVVTLYEANGVAVNPSPVAYSVGAGLNALESIPFPNIEYRVTDATDVDDEGRFWAINYFFPGDVDLAAAVDPLVEQFGEGETHRQNDAVERLVQLQYDPEGIAFTDATPIQLQLLEEDARNWEGIVRVDDRGFLLVTDQFPETILAFVAQP